MATPPREEERSAAPATPRSARPARRTSADSVQVRRRSASASGARTTRDVDDVASAETREAYKLRADVQLALELECGDEDVGEQGLVLEPFTGLFMTPGRAAQTAMLFRARLENQDYVEEDAGYFVGFSSNPQEALEGSSPRTYRPRLFTQAVLPLAVGAVEYPV